MSKQSPLVSVCMITYNQGKYIRTAMESVLNQVCDFEFDVILSNDASTDDSDKLIKEYIQSHPNGFRIKYYYQTRNLGMNPNLGFAYERCKGKYIAICEGDDFWTDPFKLQKQVDFLEVNSRFAISYHPVNVLYPDGRLERDVRFESLMEKKESTIYDLATLGNYIHTPSVVFRNLFETLPQSINVSPLGDFFLWMLIANKGDIKRNDEVMAVYRFGSGDFSTLSNQNKVKKFIKTLDVLFDELNDPTVKAIVGNRSIALKSRSFPAAIRDLDDFQDISNPEFIASFVPIKNLFLSIIIKFFNRIKIKL